MDYKLIESEEELENLIQLWQKDGVKQIAMDFEEESNLHVYGQYLCIIQIFDKTNFYLIDALKIVQKSGPQALKALFESSIEKIMFDCSSDSALVRKTLGIQILNVWDLRVAAMALGFMGNLTALGERTLGLKPEDPALKKKYQKTNWMRRPLSEEQICYALGDVTPLFELKVALEKELAQLPEKEIKQLSYNMKNCALQKNQERPGWEKICNFKFLNSKEKILIKHLFLARDNLARKANVPAANILDKRCLVAMAKSGSVEGISMKDSLREVFEKAINEAKKFY